MRTVRLALRRPGTTLALAALLLVAVQMAYGKFGHGVEFFPNVEPDFGQVIVHGRGNLSLDEKDRLVGEVEKRVLAFQGLKTVYTRIGEQPRGMSEITEDTIGVIQFEFADWKTRAARARDHGRDPRQDRRHSRHPGRGDGAARRPADRQADPGAARARSIPALLPAAAKKVAAHAGAAQRHPRSRRRPAAARHRLEDRGRQGGGRQIRRRRQHRRHARSSSSPTASRRPSTGRPTATRRSTSWCASRPTGAASTRSTTCACRPRRPRADRQFRRARAGAARRLHQPRRRQPRDDGVGQRRRRRADRQGAAGDRRASSPRPISARA